MLEYYFGQFKIKSNLYKLKGYKLFILPSLLSFFFFYPDRLSIVQNTCLLHATTCHCQPLQTCCLLPIYYTSFPPRSILLSLNFLLSLSASLATIALLSFFLSFILFSHFFPSLCHGVPLCRSVLRFNRQAKQ